MGHGIEKMLIAPDADREEGSEESRRESGDTGGRKCMLVKGVIHWND